MNRQHIFGFLGVIGINILLCVGIFWWQKLSVVQGDLGNISRLLTSVLMIVGIGIVQLVYLIPLVCYLLYVKNKELLKGVLLGAGLSLLLGLSMPYVVCGGLFR